MKTTIVYHAVRQPFTEYDEQGNVIKEGAFMLTEKVETILENDGVTVIFLGDKSKGVAKCHPGDEKYDGDVYRQSTGRKIAYLRAKIVSLTKLLRQAIKDTHTK